MATKLYPPLIEGTIPAFSGTVITVPFSLNRAVAASEIAGFVLKIKTVQTGTVLGTFKQTDETYYDLKTDLSVRFDVSSISSNLNVGQFYKIQLAFLNGTKINPTVGYYSTVGVIKYTATPTVEVSGLDNTKMNSHNYVYTGFYSQEDGDSTEKLYSTRFKLTDHTGNIIADSGEILHNNNNDNTSYEAYESFTIEKDLEEGEIYYLRMTMTTTNGLVVQSKRYKIIQVIASEPEIDGYLLAENNFEDGYINLQLIGNKNEAGLESSLIGNFSVSRAASNEDYTWHEIFSFSSITSTTSRELWDDYTIEQGVHYKYSIQQFNSNGIYSRRIISNEVSADFEDAFLYDGTRQLKIRYNPKISSFKTDVLESKMETIGSKHPFIFRNGNVYYKEFPVSGLVSYRMDDNEKFLTKEEIGLISAKNNNLYRTTSIFEDWQEPQTLTEKNLETADLVSYNIYAERIFKMSVLDWLNNGEIKLFRSPTEGNYIVRLMNSSLSPNDTLGRMLHTFSSTAYEMNDFSYENLVAAGFVKTEAAGTVTTKWKTIQIGGHSDELDEIIDSLDTYIAAGVCSILTPELRSRILNAVPEAASCIIPYNTKSYLLGSYNSIRAVQASIDSTILEKIKALKGKVTYATDNINANLIYSIDVREMLPGTILELTFQDEEVPVDIQIGNTGAYKAEFENPAVSLSIKTTENEAINVEGSITYTYNDTTDTLFSLVESYSIYDIPCYQVIGTPDTKTITDYSTNTVTTTNDIVDLLTDSRTEITSINQIKFKLRPVRDLFVNNTLDEETDEFTPVIPTLGYEGDYYYDMDCKNKVNLDNLDEIYIYRICNKRPYQFEYDNNFNVDGEYVFAYYTLGYYIKDAKKYPVFADFYYDGRTKRFFNRSTYNTIGSVNDDEIDLLEIEEYTFKDFNNTEITSIRSGNGLICEVSCQTKQELYTIEETDKMTNAKKNLYETAVTKWNSFNQALVAIGNKKYIDTIQGHNIEDTISITDQYDNIISQEVYYDATFSSIVGGSSLTNLNTNTEGYYVFTEDMEKQCVSYENTLLNNIKYAKAQYLSALEKALYVYQEGNK